MVKAEYRTLSKPLNSSLYVPEYLNVTIHQILSNFPTATHTDQEEEETSLGKNRHRSLW